MFSHPSTEKLDLPLQARWVSRIRLLEEVTGPRVDPIRLTSLSIAGTCVIRIILVNDRSSPICAQLSTRIKFQRPMLGESLNDADADAGSRFDRTLECIDNFSMVQKLAGIFRIVG